MWGSLRLKKYTDKGRQRGQRVEADQSTPAPRKGARAIREKEMARGEIGQEGRADGRLMGHRGSRRGKEET